MTTKYYNELIKMRKLQVNLELKLKQTQKLNRRYKNEIFAYRVVICVGMMLTCIHIANVTL